MSRDKFGSYIQRLMTTVMDKEQEEFVTDLAWNELKNINSKIDSFLRNTEKDESEQIEQTKKQLLQEEKQDVKDN